MLHHLQNGISRMIPFVVAGAVFMALGGRLPAGSPLIPLLQNLGTDGGLLLMLPVLAGFIAQSIAGWDGLLPGMIGGLIATRGGSGMLGAILAGFLAGYLSLGLLRVIRLPAVLKDLAPMVLVPVFATLGVGLTMLLAVNPPVSLLMRWLHGWLLGLQGQSVLVMGAILGAMGAVDLGGPANKVAALFAFDLLAQGIAEPLGAVVAGVMAAPNGIALAMLLAPRRWSPDERRQGRTAFLLGLANIIEASIPIALAAPRRVIPAVTLGAAVSGAISMLLGVAVRLPVGGFFTLLVPGMVGNIPGYLLAVAAGAGVTALGLLLLKPVYEG